jgi:hypothetical protein
LSRPAALLERMRLSKAGWRLDDLTTLYLGYGFEMIEGGKHRLFIHPEHRDLRATVTRARDLPKGYVSCAVRLVTELLKREAETT